MCLFEEDMMKGGFSRAIAASVSLLLVLTMAGCTPAADTVDAGSDTEPYKIGAVLSLTGTYAALGSAAKDAIELEVARINEGGGINGRPIEVLIEDDATEEAKAVAAASKLIDREGVIAIIGASGTGQSMAMRDELKRAGVPQLSLAGGTVITDQFDPLVFQTPWSNRIVVPFVLEAAAERRTGDGPVRIALVSDTGGYGKDGRVVILEEIESMDSVELVADETFNPGDNDMSAQLTRAKSKQPDVLLMWTAGKEAATLIKNASELGLDVPVFGGSGQARAEFAAGAGEAAEGFIFGTGRSLVADNWPDDSPEYAAVSSFAERFSAKYGSAPDIFAGHAYDAVAIVADALARIDGDATPAAMRDAIEQTQSLAGFGGAFSFSPTNHNGLTASDLALYRIEGGKWVAEK
jgi:branched-chain amino acid transport system substrate-binding protein